MEGTVSTPQEDDTQLQQDQVYQQILDHVNCVQSPFHWQVKATTASASPTKQQKVHEAASEHVCTANNGGLEVPFSGTCSAGGRSPIPPELQLQPSSSGGSSTMGESAGWESDSSFSFSFVSCAALPQGVRVGAQSLVWLQQHLPKHLHLSHFTHCLEDALLAQLAASLDTPPHMQRCMQHDCGHMVRIPITPDNVSLDTRAVYATANKQQQPQQQRTPPTELLAAVQVSDVRHGPREAATHLAAYCACPHLVAQPMCLTWQGPTPLLLMEGGCTSVRTIIGRCCSRLPGSVATPAAVTHIAAALLTCVRTLHSAHIIHMDIKPDNVILTGLHPITVKVAGFSVAQTWDKAYGGWHGRKGCTPCYAPAWRGSRASLLHPGTDAHCAGVTLWELGMAAGAAQKLAPHNLSHIKSHTYDFEGVACQASLDTGGVSDAYLTPEFIALVRGLVCGHTVCSGHEGGVGTAPPNPHGKRAGMSRIQFLNQAVPGHPYWAGSAVQGRVCSDAAGIADMGMPDVQQLLGCSPWDAYGRLYASAAIMEVSQAWLEHEEGIRALKCEKENDHVYQAALDFAELSAQCKVQRHMRKVAGRLL